jgi:hypothetical protein
MVITRNIIASSKAPMRYFTQSGVADSVGVGEGGGGAGGGEAGVGARDAACTSSGGEAVVKAPTALQSL